MDQPRYLTEQDDKSAHKNELPIRDRTPSVGSVKGNGLTAPDGVPGGALVNENKQVSPSMPYYSNLPPMLRETDGESDSSPTRIGNHKSKSVSPGKDTRILIADDSQRQINIEIQGD